MTFLPLTHVTQITRISCATGLFVNRVLVLRDMCLSEVALAHNAISTAPILVLGLHDRARANLVVARVQIIAPPARPNFLSSQFVRFLQGPAAVLARAIVAATSVDQTTRPSPSTHQSTELTQEADHVDVEG